MNYLEEKIMKFDVVVGNPPYQESQDVNNYAEPIYPYFFDLAEELANEYILISPARFLFNVGATKSSWNEKMLNNRHIKVVYFNQNSTSIFPNTDIKGGVSITFYSKYKNYESIGTFTAFEELKTILYKVSSIEQGRDNLGSLIHVQTKFNLSNLYNDYPNYEKKLGNKGKDKRIRQATFDALPEIFFDAKQSKNQVSIYGRQDNKRVYKWINSEYIESDGNFSYFKVFVPASNGSGAIGEVLSTPVIGHPVIGHTQTFISIGSFKTEFEAQSLLNYLKTKFARTMLGIKKVTQDNKAKETWSKVPLQDFTTKSDIDWSKSISEIDQQLYKKYNLSQNEIDFIEDKVKAMD